MSMALRSRSEKFNVKVYIKVNRAINTLKFPTVHIFQTIDGFGL